MATFGSQLNNTPRAFQPAVSGGASRSYSSSSARVALAGTGDQALVTNYGTVAAFVNFGDSSVTATTSDLCVLPGTSVLVTIPPTAEGGSTKSTYIAAISVATAGTIQVQTGWGI